MSGIYIRYFLRILSWVIPSLLCAQQQVVKGRVVDRNSQQPLFGATVIISSLSPPRGATTDEKGYFRLEGIPYGRHDVTISYLGYETVTLRQVQVGAGKEVLLTVEMTEKAGQLKPVEIKAGDDKEKPLNDMATVSARTLDIGEAQRYAAGFNDPARMALSFAGVVAGNDASNEIIIRGNSARGLLWRLEGLEIPNPNHFSNGDGGTGGGISMLSSQVVGRSDFFTGAFPAEYGNALSGVFDLHLRKGNSDRREYALQLGVLGLQTALEGPLRKGYGGSYLLNYRYSTLRLLDLMGFRLVRRGMVPEFQDLSFHVHLPAGKAGILSVWGLGGLSRAQGGASRDSSQWAQRRDRFRDTHRQGMGVAGLSYFLPLPGHKTYLKAVAAYAREYLGYNLDSLDNTYALQPVYNERYEYSFLRTHVFLNHKFSSRHVVRGGFYYTYLHFNLFSRGLILGTQEFGTFLNERGHSGMVQSYGQWKWRFRDNADVNVGLHHLTFLLNGSTAVEPRLGLQWRLKSGDILSFGAGLHSRSEPLSTYMMRVETNSGQTLQPNITLRPARSAHAVAGYERMLAENLRIKTEVYFQYLFHVPVDTQAGSIISVLNATAEAPRVVYSNRGLGRNYGWELTLEKFFARRYFFLFTASLFRSQYSMGDGRWLNTRFNAGHMINALGGYEAPWGKKREHTAGVNARLLWRGGNFYTPIDTAVSVAAGREVLRVSEAFSRRLPAYFRMDCSATLRLNFRRWAFSFSAEVQNITNRLNVMRYFFDPYTRQVQTAYMFGIMPVLNVKAEF